MRIGVGSESRITGCFQTLKDIGRGNYFSLDLDTFVQITEHFVPSDNIVTHIDLLVTRFKRPDSGGTRLDRLGVTSEDYIDYSGSIEFVDGKSKIVPPARPSEILTIVEQVMQERGK